VKQGSYFSNTQSYVFITEIKTITENSEPRFAATQDKKYIVTIG